MISFIFTFKTSLFIISMLLYNENLSFKISIILLSNSIAITFLAFFNNSFVNVPSPGPISITRSSLDIFALSTILDITWSSIRKFCPSDLFACIPYFFIINLVSSYIFMGSPFLVNILFYVFRIQFVFTDAQRAPLQCNCLTCLFSFLHIHMQLHCLLNL